MKHTKQSDEEQAATQKSRSEDGEGAHPGKNDQQRPREIGGRKGPDPVRYGDWEKNGRCIDF